MWGKNEDINRYSRCLKTLTSCGHFLKNLIKNENKLKKKEDTGFRKQGLQNRKRVKGSPGLWGVIEWHSLVTGTEENGSSLHTPGQKALEETLGEGNWRNICEHLAERLANWQWV